MTKEEFQQEIARLQKEQDYHQDLADAASNKIEELIKQVKNQES